MYCVQYSVLCTVHCTVYSAVQYCVQCSTVLYTVYCTQYTVLCTVQCTVYTMNAAIVMRPRYTCVGTVASRPCSTARHCHIRQLTAPYSECSSSTGTDHRLPVQSVVPVQSIVPAQSECFSFYSLALSFLIPVATVRVARPLHSFKTFSLYKLPEK